MRIVVTVPFQEPQKEMLRKQAQPHEIFFGAKEDVPEEWIQTAEIWMGNPAQEQLKKAKNLKWLQLNSAGANVYCRPGVLLEPVLLTSASGAYHLSVSENMLAYTMGLFKKLYRYYDNQKQQLWRDEGHVRSARGAVILVLGMGDIGTAYAQKMKAMGSTVIGVRKSSRDRVDGFDEVYLVEELDRILPRADLTAITLPDTAETRGLLGEERLRKMKKGSYLINVGRGTIVHTDALIRVMEEGHLAGVVLDVTDPEPLPKEHELWKVPNVYITPHIAGGFHIDETLETICAICCENLNRYCNGQPLQHIVNRSRGY